MRFNNDRQRKAMFAKINSKTITEKDMIDKKIANPDGDGVYTFLRHDDKDEPHLHIKLEMNGEDKVQSYVIPKNELPDKKNEKKLAMYLGKFDTKEAFEKGKVIGKGDVDKEGDDFELGSKYILKKIGKEKYLLTHK